MTTTTTNFVNQNYYHLYNRGVAKQKIFSSDGDYEHFLKTFGFYLEKSPKTKLSHADEKEIKILNITRPKKPLVMVLGYCLMPNHFHLLVKQLSDNGISIFMRRSLDSYTRYFNTRYERIGPLYQGRFKAICVENDEQLLHLSRYIHLNPFLGHLTQKPNDYPWSSYHFYLNNQTLRLCNPKFILDVAGSKKEYEEFVNDYASYLQAQEKLDKLLLE